MPPKKKGAAAGKDTPASEAVVRTSRKRKVYESGDSQLAWALQEKELEGHGTPAAKAKKESKVAEESDPDIEGTASGTFRAKGATYPDPFLCPACGGEPMDKKQTMQHLVSAAHAKNVERGLESNVWTGKTATAMRASVWYEEPTHDFAKAARLEPEIQLTKARMPAKSQADLQATLMAMVANPEKKLSHSDSNARDKVFIITPEACAQYNGREREIPSPAYCEMCTKDLKNAYALADHMTGKSHALKLKEWVNKTYGVGEVEEGYRVREEMRTPTGSSSAGTPGGPRNVQFACPRSRCNGKLSGREGGEARCRECSGEFTVPRPSGNSGKKYH